MAISIVRRMLTDPEITELVENIRLFPDLAYVSPKRWKHFTDPYCIIVNGHFAGICAIYTFNIWVKLGPLVLLKKYQGNGLGKKLLTNIFEDYHDKSIFIASSNPIVQHIAKTNKFTELSSFFSLPREIQSFLLKHLAEHMNTQFIVEGIRKKFFLQRGGTKFYVKLANF